MCLFVVICSLMDRLAGTEIYLGWIVDPLGFAYGIIAANNADRIKCWMKRNWLRKSGILMILSAVLGTAYLKLKMAGFFGDYILKMLMDIVMIVLMFEVISRLKVGNHVSFFLGEISYEVYLLHHGVIAFLMGCSASMDSGVFVVAVVMITIILSFMLNRACRPVIKMFRKRLGEYGNG